MQPNQSRGQAGSRIGLWPNGQYNEIVCMHSRLICVHEYSSQYHGSLWKRMSMHNFILSLFFNINMYGTPSGFNINFDAYACALRTTEGLDYLKRALAWYQEQVSWKEGFTWRVGLIQLHRCTMRSLSAYYHVLIARAHTHTHTHRHAHTTFTHARAHKHTQPHIHTDISISGI